MTGVEISVLLSAILRALLGLYLTARLLGKCEHFSPRCALVGVAVLGALAFGWPNPAQMMLEVAAMALCAAWLLGCDGRMSLFVATFYEIALALWSFLAAAWLGVAFADAAFLDGASAQAQTALWLVHGLALVLVLIFRSRTLSRALAMKGFAAFFLASLLALISLEEQHRLAIPADATELQLMLTLILMIGVLVYNLRSQLDTERELAELRAAQAESAEREQRRITETYEANAKLFHDLHNHLSVLRRLLAQDKSAEAAAPCSALLLQRMGRPSCAICSCSRKMRATLCAATSARWRSTPSPRKPCRFCRSCLLSAAGARKHSAAPVSARFAACCLRRFFAAVCAGSPRSGCSRFSLCSAFAQERACSCRCLRFLQSQL